MQKIFEKLFQRAKEAKKGEFKPFNWNFENGVVLQGRMVDSRLEIQFVKNKEVLFDFDNLIPPNVALRFDPREKWEFDDRDQEKLQIVFGNFRAIEDLLKFIHEVGHSHDLETLSQWRNARKKSNDEMLKDKKYAYPPSRLRALQEYWDLDHKVERFAWDFVAKTVAELEKNMGINIQGKLARSQNLEEFASKVLKNNEKRFLNELYDADIYSRQGLDFVMQLIEKHTSPEIDEKDHKKTTE